jgi:uncharacterized membrane protein YdbT with pleckstrin-like domain
MADMRTQAVMGVIPPTVAEAKIAERWPTVAAFPFVSKPACGLQELAKNILLATFKLPVIAAAVLLLVTFPLALLIALAAWLMLAPFFALKIAPVFMTRYLLTNRRLVIQRGWSRKPVQEVKLEEIEKVQVAAGTEQEFYTSADLEIISAGKPIMTLRGVDEFKQFQIQIENAYLAWGRKNPPTVQLFPGK